MGNASPVGKLQVSIQWRNILKQFFEKISRRQSPREGLEKIVHEGINCGAQTASENGSEIIFDIGFHKGHDARYYMDLGYRVLGIEANPILAEEGEQRFSEEISQGKLILKNAGIHTERGVLDFYVNDQVDEWSSFDRGLGMRGGEFHVIQVSCVTLEDLVSEYGMPKHLKIDVEGLDAAIVRTVAGMPVKPEYVSIEDGGIDSMVAMFEAGVRKFKFTNQPYWHGKPRGIDGPDAKATDLFGPSTSGPFGDNIPGEWMDTHHAFKFYVDHVRPPGQPPIDGWWDIHGTYT